MVYAVAMAQIFANSGLSTFVHSPVPLDLTSDVFLPPPRWDSTFTLPYEHGLDCVDCRACPARRCSSNPKRTCLGKRLDEPWQTHSISHSTMQPTLLRLSISASHATKCALTCWLAGTRDPTRHHYPEGPFRTPRRTTPTSHLRSVLASGTIHKQLTQCPDAACYNHHCQRGEPLINSSFPSLFGLVPID